jgi:hypothetical protein
MSDVRRTPPRGVTLLELMVTIGIGTMIFVILGAIFLAQARFFSIQDALAETQIHAFRSIDTMGLYVISAKRVVPSATINGATYSTTNSLVVLELPSINSSGALIASIYDYVALGKESATSTNFMFDMQAGTGSTRLTGKFNKAQLVDKVIFRYNAVNSASATAIDMYVRTKKDARGQTIYTPLGKIFYLGAL